MAFNYYRVSIGSQKSGKWNREKSHNSINICKQLEVINSRPLIRMAISHSESLIAAGDQIGYVYMIDMAGQAFFVLPSKFDSCVTCITFADTNADPIASNDINLIVATCNNNSIHCVHFDARSASSQIIASLSSVHKTCVNHISVSGERMLTSSPYDRCCLWDLNTLTLVKQLEDDRCSLTAFVAGDRILSTYRNNVIYLFDADTFHVTNTYRHRKLITVQPNQCFVTRITTNGTTDCLDIHTVNAENAVTVRPLRNIDYGEATGVKQLYCCNSNRIIVYLNGDGFLKCRHDQFDHTRYLSLTLNNDLMAAITAGGDLHVFNLRLLSTVRLKKVTDAPTVELELEGNQQVVRQLSLTLLDKHRRFPDKYRYYIWSKLLGLPHNKDTFRVVQRESYGNYSEEIQQSLGELQRRYQLIDDALRHALVRTCSQLIYWRPSLTVQLDSLALFVFPFVKLLHRNECLLFEILATLIANNYFMDDGSRPEFSETAVDILRRECFKLESHYAAYQITAEDYCWPMITSGFSEVFLRGDWLIVWDQLMVYGPELMVYMVVAYNCVVQNSIIQQHRSLDDIRAYFRRQNSVPVGKVIQVAHQLVDKYDDNRSLEPFTATPLPKGVYN